MKITKLQKVTSSGIVSGDYSGEVNKYYINVVFEMPKLLFKQERAIKIKVDMDYDKINFDDVNSISETMMETALNRAYVKYACDLVDEETITGKIGVDFEVSTPEGDVFNCKNDDVFQLRDITNMMPLKDRGALCKAILEQNDIITCSNDDDKIIRFKGSHINEENEEYIEGYMRLSDADSDNPLYFYDYEGFEVGNRYPDNPYHKEGEFNQWLDYEHLKLNMELDDDITQYLVDFADKNIKITRADFEYVLEINY